MNELKVIEEVITTRTPISFEYVRERKTPGDRIGNPHAVYLRKLQSGEKKVYLDVWQTGGVTDSRKGDSKKGELPGWTTCFLDDVVNIELKADEAPFDITTNYNPHADKFKFAIAKI